MRTQSFGQCEVEMDWAKGLKISTRCSHPAKVIIEGKKLCTFHANRMMAGDHSDEQTGEAVQVGGRA